MIMRKTIVLLILMSFFFFDGFTQAVLPQGFATGEKQQMLQYLTARSVSGIETPPPFQVRTAAEWEEIEYLTITWTSYESILREIVRAAQTECKIIINCTDSNAVKNFLFDDNVSDINLEFIEQDYNSIWIRDYGANTVYKNDVDDLILVDWIYNRPRPDDDAISEGIANYLGLDLYTTTAIPYDLVHTGGNFMSDGFGTAFSSELVLEENDFGAQFNLSVHDEVAINDIMNQFMGINTYIKMDNLPFDGIHHIDMHMKLLNEETLLVGEFPQGISDGPQLEANLQYVLSNFTNKYGKPFNVIRIPMPPSTNGSYPPQGYYRTYTNSMFINKTLIVPTYREEYDTTALRIYEEALPGYTIVPIDCDNSGSNIISASGALHCITHSVGVSSPLLISHESLTDITDITAFADTSNLIRDVSALIKHQSGISSASLFYSTDLSSGLWSEVNMNLTSNDIWTAELPINLPLSNSNIVYYYYISAISNSGKTQKRPIVAPDGYYTFKVNALSNIASNNIELELAFPNPASAITCVPVNSSNSTFANIKLVDITGRNVLTIYKGEISSGYSRYFFDARKINKGLYLIVLETPNTKITQIIAVN